jgi:hypothetical protein
MPVVKEAFTRLPLATEVEGSLDFICSPGGGVSYLTSVRGKEVTRIWLNSDALCKLKNQLLEIFGG